MARPYELWDLETGNAIGGFATEREALDAVRDAAAADIQAELAAICTRRGLQYSLEETMRAAAAPW